jgi:2-iminobutanoate/2-iminopropanoate deaminase
MNKVVFTEGAPTPIGPYSQAIQSGSTLYCAGQVPIDMADYPAMNEVYATYFPRRAPARTTVQVSALPRGARIEIDAIAVAE